MITANCFSMKALRSFAFCLVAFPGVSHAVLIQNGIPEGTLGHFSVDVLTGGETVEGFVTAERFASQDIVTSEVIFDYLSFVDPGTDGQGFRLFGSDPVPDPFNPNIVTSTGLFPAVNGNTIVWTATSTIVAGTQAMVTRYTFTTDNGGPLGPLRFLQYLDEDVESFGDDVFISLGTATEGNLSLFTRDDTEVYGVRQSGATGPAFGLVSSAFAGWAAGQYPLMLDRIQSEGQVVSVGGFIDDALPSFVHPQLGPVFGPRDITSVLAWDVAPNANSATIFTILGGEGGLPVTPPPPPIVAKPANPRAPVACASSRCNVRIECNLVPLPGAQCGIRTTLLARVRVAPRLSDGKVARGPIRLVRFAFGVSNIPPSQNASVRLKLTRIGRQILQTSKNRRLRGVIEIRNTAGELLSSTNVRIRLR